MRKIIIAGAGHGGLSAAAYLAEKGYDVHIYEKNKRAELGYDWDDSMNNRTFEYAGIAEFDKKDVIPRMSAGFYSTSMKTSILFDFPIEATNYEIQRKVLYKYLLDNAEKKGVKFHFSTTVNNALINSANGKVAGLIVDGKEISADMVIDSAGMFSPVRNSLPSSYNVNNKFNNEEIFYVYRACFNTLAGKEIIGADRFNIYFKFCGIQGIAWFKLVDGLSDVLIGSTKPITMDEINGYIDELRKVQPCIGKEIIKGGIITHIPLRACFSKIVGDNYAAIGDCMAMTVPFNGSGITNSILAGKYLSETITNIDLANNEPAYTNENLWDYQVKYMKNVGSSMVSIDIIKKCLLKYSPKVLDYFFDSGVLSAAELRAGTLSEEIKLGFTQIIDKVKKGYKKLPMLIKLSLAVSNSKKAKLHALKIPNVYNENAVRAWRNKYEDFLK